MSNTNVTAKFAFTGFEVESAIEEAYKRDAGKYKIKGFRDGGKAPRKMIEQQYGDVFTEPALNFLFNKAFNEYLKKNPEIIPLDDPEVSLEPKKDGIEFVAKIDIQPKFTVAKYKGLEIKLKAIKIGDAEIDGFLKRVAEGRARQVAADKGHKIVKGNIAVIDFTGYVDGKKFDGGEAKNHQLEIGSHSFIDTFEDQLVGKTIGDKLDVNVTFPKEYHAEQLAGAKAVFKVEVRNVLIKEIPAIDDNLAKESSEFDTLKDFRADIKKRLEDQAKAEMDAMREQEIIRTIAEATKIDVHPKLVDRYYNSMMDDLNNKLAQSGFNIEMYAQYHGMTLEKFEEVQRKTALNSAKASLILNEIAKIEKLKNFDAALKFLKEENKCLYQ